MVIAAFLGILKVDSFLVLWGCLVATIALKPSLVKHSLVRMTGTFGIGMLAFLAQLKLVPYFSRHPMGALVPKYGPLVEGHTIDGFSSILETAEALLSRNGGFFGTSIVFGDFLVSGSWLGLIRNAPWVTLSPGFWLAELPLAFGFSLRGDHAILWNYYSMPFVPFVWVFAAKFLRGKSARWSLAALILSLTNGSESLRLYFPTKELVEYRAEAKSFSQELTSIQSTGIVPSNLIPFVPINRIISDRFPPDTQSEAKVDFYFLPKNVDQYGMSQHEIEAKVSNLMAGNEFLKVRESKNFILFKRALDGNTP
jgi:hypothetical protein